jgi:hypothetical protein
MPSGDHAILVELFRASPGLVSAVLPRLGVNLPDATNLEVLESTLPVDVRDFHADLAIALRDGPSPPKVLVLIEVQLSRSTRKRATWLLYHAAAQLRHRCEVVILVISPDASVARWASRPVPVGPNGSYAPVVLGPHELPSLTELEPQRASPDLAVLSLLVHGRGADKAVLRRASLPILALESSVARLYFGLLWSSLGERYFGAVEGLMIGGEPINDVFKKYYREGKAEGEAQALLRVLSARALVPTPTQRAAILACRDLPRLDRWLDAAMRASSVDEVLRDSVGRKRR